MRKFAIEVFEITLILLPLGTLIYFSIKEFI